MTSPNPEPFLFHEAPQEDEDIERYSKRPKLDEDVAPTEAHILPPSHALLGVPLPEAKEGIPMTFLESNVGISEYVGRSAGKIEGIIKQRFTDFLVYEIDQDGNVIHLKNIENPESTVKNSATSLDAPVQGDTTMESEEKKKVQDVDREEANEASSSKQAEVPDKAQPQSAVWSDHFDTTLAQFLSESAVAQLKQMYLEGPEPPRVSDSGWGSRVTKTPEELKDSTVLAEPEQASPDNAPDKRRRGKDRGNRSGRGGGRGGKGDREDNRKVLSNPMDSKESRTALHKAIRELFGGKLDSETDTSPSAMSDDGSRVVIRWAKRGRGRGGRTRGSGRAGVSGRGERAPRGTYPPYIHFTMQKTNRDTQDALGHLARTLHVNVKDLSVAGTKDKRGVTVQRVSLKRGNKSVEDVWNLANGINGRRSMEDALTQRGERGIRLADFNYRRASLELGMLKGNAFIITLRSVKTDSIETLNEALTSIKHKGFINYYGMQRFGTASVPTHAVGLALLKSDWHKAVSLILQKRPGEHPDVEAARDAWLVEGNLDKAIELMPRRVVAERCILESYKKQKGDTRNAMGALSTIPRNLRLMYVHAYQSYVWNAIVSERIRTYGAGRPIVGDLVFETDAPGSEMTTDVDIEEAGVTPEVDHGENEEEALTTPKRSRKTWVAPRIKTLTEKDLTQYTIFDVIMPLPGTDVAYPGGKLGERYREFLLMDGLDPDNFVRKQREYTLNGSYRAMLHLPKELSWSVLRYTDPDVALAQADEDKLLGFDPPLVSEDGKFMALQINIALGTASYATMALREITKTETSSHFQTGLTNASEDQRYRGIEATKEKEV